MGGQGPDKGRLQRQMRLTVAPVEAIGQTPGPNARQPPETGIYEVRPAYLTLTMGIYGEVRTFMT